MKLPFWFAQKSKNDNPAATLKNLIYHTKVPVTRTSVEQAVKQHRAYPALSLQVLDEILAAWHFETRRVQINLEDLQKVPLPAISCISGDEGSFVLLHHLANGQLRYIHPGIGWVEEPLAAFGRKWTGSVLLAIPTGQTGEPWYEQKKEEEHIKQQLNPLRHKVRIIDAFLSDRECDYIISYAAPLFESSLVISAEAREVHQGRTSHSAMLRATGDPVLNAVYQRASHLLGMPEAYLEYGQCVSYTKGQEYQPHFDTLDEKSPLGKETIARYGQRAITLLVYLNDDFEGGETYFPNLDCKVSPKKGTAVVFHLLDKDYRVDPYALHAGLPVFSGRKYAFNLWVWNKPFRKLSQ